MSTETELAAVAVALRSTPGDKPLAELGRVLADEWLDRWAARAPEAAGRLSMPDTLGQLRTMAGVRRKDLAYLLAGLPRADMERALDPALRDSWTELAAAVRAYEAKLHHFRQTAIIYGGFVPKEMEDAEGLLDQALSVVRRYPMDARSDRAEETASRIRELHTALEDLVRTAACAAPARLAETLTRRRSESAGRSH